MVYRGLMKLDYDNKRTRAGSLGEGPEAPERKTPLEQMEAFYELQNGQPMSEEQRAFMERLMEEIREVDV